MASQTHEAGNGADETAQKAAFRPATVNEPCAERRYLYANTIA